MYNLTRLFYAWSSCFVGHPFERRRYVIRQNAILCAVLLSWNGWNSVDGNAGSNLENLISIKKPGRRRRSSCVFFSSRMSLVRYFVFLSPRAGCSRRRRVQRRITTAFSTQTIHRRISFHLIIYAHVFLCFLFFCFFSMWMRTCIFLFFISLLSVFSSFHKSISTKK